MELNKEHYRAVIFYNFTRGLSRKECFEEINRVFGDKSCSLATVKRWYNEFQRGRLSLNDNFRAPKPKTAVTEKNIGLVRNMIEEDRHVTARSIQATLKIGVKAIDTILHKHLMVRKLCARWIPHNLTPVQKENRVAWCRSTLDRFDNGSSHLVYNIITGDETWVYCYDPERKQQSAVWVFENESAPTKVVREKSRNKKMVAIFFGITGHVSTVALEDRRTVNAEWYTTVCLPQVLQNVREKRPRGRIILHQDNARAHTAARTTEYLNAQNIEIMGHSPYSPDLAPNDFFLIPRVKNKLRGLRFTSAEEAVDAFKNEINNLTREDWRKCFEDWFSRMQKCIDCGGEYFEKL